MCYERWVALRKQRWRTTLGAALTKEFSVSTKMTAKTRRRPRESAQVVPKVWSLRKRRPARTKRRRCGPRVAPRKRGRHESPRVPVGQHNRGHEDFESEDDDERKRRRLEGDIKKNIF